MMATTELDKIPETILSRSQVYEFRNISTKAIATQLRKIMDAEGITVGEDSLQLIARDADGSMRDAQSKLDQVIAFTGKTIAPDDVATVLGLVGRDLLLDTLQAVADEDAPASFALAARAEQQHRPADHECGGIGAGEHDGATAQPARDRVQDCKAEDCEGHEQARCQRARQGADEIRQEGACECPREQARCGRRQGQSRHIRPGSRKAAGNFHDPASEPKVDQIGDR
jgi:DNA polymerase III gamma/tau subunit